MDIIEYTPDFEDEWNRFVKRSKNGTFMFDRDYMEYHSDRFQDNSLVVYYKGNPIALFPANRADNVLVSHEGLTFGGFLTGEKIKTEKMLDAFDLLRSYAEDAGFDRVLYKAIPTVYHHYPAEEDRYALFRQDASLTWREVTSAVDLETAPDFQKTRQRSIDDASDAGVEVRETGDFATYWELLQTNLAERHGVEPVHSLNEIELLADRFPENIRLFCSYLDDDILGGVVVYESEVVARAQYIANSDAGRDVGALDIIFDHLFTNTFTNKRFFDLGVSTEKDGRFLNEGLTFFKEGFGARGVVHDFYELGI